MSAKKENDNNLETLAGRLRAIREFRKFSQDELAGLVGVTQNAISYIEQGRSGSTRLIITFSKALDCDPVWLDTGKGFSPFSKTLQYAGSCTKIPLIAWEDIKNQTED
jgi:transcriptional regulator with XRE-family HTH domain